MHEKERIVLRVFGYRFSLWIALISPIRKNIQKKEHNYDPPPKKKTANKLPI